MNLPKMRDFLVRLSSAYNQAVQSGDTQRADGFAQLIAQAEPHVQQAVQQQHIMPKQQGPSLGGAMQQGYSQQAPPQAAPQPPDIQREAQQEAGQSWMDKLFTGKSSYSPVDPWTQKNMMAPGANNTGGVEDLAKGVGQMKPTDVGNVALYSNPITAWAKGTYDVLGNPSVQKFFGDVLANKPLAQIGEKPTAVQKKGSQEAVINTDNVRVKEPGKEYFDPNAREHGMNMAEAIANGRANTLSQEEKDRIEKNNARDERFKAQAEALGDKPGNTLADFLGVLAGGKSYLRSMENERRNWEHRADNLANSYNQTQEAQDYHDLINNQKQQQMGLELLKAQTEDERKRAESSASDMRNLVRTVGGAMAPAEAAKVPVVRSEMQRLQEEAAARKRALEAKRAPVKKE